MLILEKVIKHFSIAAYLMVGGWGKAEWLFRGFLFVCTPSHT